MIAYTEATKRKFVFIIDEWDAVIKDSENLFQDTLNGNKTGYRPVFDDR